MIPCVKVHWLALVSGCVAVAALAPVRFTGAALTPQATGSPTAQSAAIIAENQRSGTQNWHIFDAATQHQIEGFASATSVNRGSVLDLFVNTIAPSYRVEIYRMGWYGGSGARLVKTIGPLLGWRQPPCPTDIHGVVSCRWQHPYRLVVQSDWLSGVYLAKLTVNPYLLSTARLAPAWQSYVPFVVRDDAGSSALLFQTGVTTYEMSNGWNLSRSPVAGSASCAASFDRPYAQGFGSGDFLLWEYPMLRWLEMNGYEVSYDTDIDTDTSPSLLLRHKAVLSAGRDAYWTAGMRSATQAALAHGVSLGIFGDAGYYRIQLASSSIGPRRTIYCIGERATPRPTARLSSAPLGSTYRLPIAISRVRLMEDHTRRANVPVQQGLRFVDTRTWPFGGTGLRDGDVVPGITNGEYSYAYYDASTPPTRLIVLGTSPMVSANGPESAVSTTLYTAPSGAYVFTAGSPRWSWGLDDEQLTASSTIWISHQVANAALARLTANILNRVVHSAASAIPALRATTTSRPAPSGWFTQPPIITVRPSVPLSSGAITQCSLDGGASWRPYAGPIVLRTSGSGFLECRASVGGASGPIVASQFPTDLGAVGVRVLSPHPWQSFGPSETIALLWSYDQPSSGIAWNSALAVLDHTPINNGQVLNAADLQPGNHVLHIEIRSGAGARTAVMIPFVVRG